MTTQTETQTDREYADMRDTTSELDGGFLIAFDDDSQIDATQTSDDGLVLGAGKRDGSGWAELNLTWTAVQALADELNNLTRQARIDGRI